ncbi:hypothetical protein SO802_009775 [Lithocarpus litseifolius]|uniref:Uncharacterized protein n=1 Tax=Lithocarpus litseifolius TaxID=425828 RepID=A0AAW2DFA7_9ROSI
MMRSSTQITTNKMQLLLNSKSQVPSEIERTSSLQFGLRDMSMSFVMLQLNGLDLMISASNDENTYYKLRIRAVACTDNTLPKEKKHDFEFLVDKMLVVGKYFDFKTIYSVDYVLCAKCQHHFTNTTKLKCRKF